MSITLKKDVKLPVSVPSDLRYMSIKRNKNGALSIGEWCTKESECKCENCLAKNLKP